MEQCALFDAFLCSLAAVCFWIARVAECTSQHSSELCSRAQRWLRSRLLASEDAPPDCLPSPAAADKAVKFSVPGPFSQECISRSGPGAYEMLACG